jgi:hypothetical protein
MINQKEKNPKDEDEDEDPKLLERIKILEEKLSHKNKSILRIGDIELASNKSGLRECKEITEEILKSKPIRNYLGLFGKKKYALPSYFE